MDSLDLNNTVGALEVAIGISGFLMGCATIQTYTYYQRYPFDAKWMKCFVALIWSLEFCQHISAMHVVFVMSVTAWGDPLLLTKQPSSLQVCFFSGIFITPLIETFYLWRIYNLYKKPLPFIIGAFLAWLRLSGWCLFVVEESRLGYASGELFAKWQWLLTTLLAGGVVLDGAIAVTMVAYLYQNRDSPFLRTKKLVETLIIWTIQTGVLTVITFLITLITWLTMPNALIWMGSSACSTKVFSNCLLSSLNARRELHAQLESDPLNFSTLNFSRSNRLEAIAVDIRPEENELPSFSAQTSMAHSEAGKDLDKAL